MQNQISWHLIIPSVQDPHMFSTLLVNTVKPVLSGHPKRPKIGFQDRQDRLLLNAGQKYCRMLSWSILQYFQPSLTSTICLRPLFCIFLSGPLRQVLLYMYFLTTGMMHVKKIKIGEKVSSIARVKNWP